MYTLKISILLGLLASASLGYANDMSIVEGTLEFRQGDAYLLSGDERLKLYGLTDLPPMLENGSSIRIEGEKSANSIEVYKLDLKSEQSYATLYDWASINADYYDE